MRQQFQHTALTAPLLTDFDDVLLHLIGAARARAMAAVHKELIDLSWNIGEHISRKIAADGWGQATVEALADLKPPDPYGERLQRRGKAGPNLPAGRLGDVGEGMTPDGSAQPVAATDARDNAKSVDLYDPHRLVLCVVPDP
jgi:hypothetical protein